MFTCCRDHDVNIRELIFGGHIENEDLHVQSP